MSKYNDTILHRIETLLTLDYLLNYTDNKHPATQQDICRYAREFNLKYEGGKPGDDVRRQRIGDCLQWLQSICYKFEKTDKIPFVIRSTDSGKFYIEEKNHLNKEQIIKILSSIKNDKYLKDEDTDLLIDKLLILLTNKHNRESVKQELEVVNRKAVKFNSSVSRKIRLINKAYLEKKAILIYQSRFGKIDDKLFGTIDQSIYCRVYRIEEHNNKPYVILIPINRYGVIFDSIQNINVPNFSEREVLMDDDIDDDRLEELFKANNKYLAMYYGSLDEYIDNQVNPEGGYAYKSSFYFDYRNIDIIRRSFEEYFSKEMPVIRCSSFKINREEVNRGNTVELPHKDDKYAIECEEVNSDINAKYGVVNIIINKNALVSWLFNNPNIADIVNVVSPNSINEVLGNRFLGLFLKYKDDVGNDNIEKALKSGSVYRSRYTKKK